MVQKKKEIGDDRFWKDCQRFIDSIRSEAHSSIPDRVSIDFWLFKIERRFKILKDAIEEKEQMRMI